ncbi:MAG TPA: thioredoxin domain-containing protein [Gemmatimonadales bacterium]|nr:thioredoxin domain-containing protein [Gemmatimonadales bacterium]
MPRRTASGLALALVLAVAPAAAQQTQGTPLDDLRTERTRGKADAPVTMYEISDFECPYCGQFWRETLPSIERDYIATGKLRLIFVNMPLSSIHPNAEPAAELAMCAARQHKFWQMHDLLFRNQDHWADLREPGSYFLSLGDSLHLNRSQLQECLRTKATRPAVEADFDGSRKSGATSTPTFYVEGELIVGAQSYGLFKQVLDSIIRVKAGGR